MSAISLQVWKNRLNQGSHSQMEMSYIIECFSVDEYLKMRISSGVEIEVKTFKSIGRTLRKIG